MFQEDKTPGSPVAKFTWARTLSDWPFKKPSLLPKESWSIFLKKFNSFTYEISVLSDISLQKCVSWEWEKGGMQGKEKKCSDIWFNHFKH